MSTSFPWSWNDWTQWKNFLKNNYPVLSFHSKEDYKPYNVEDYMHYTSLKNDKNNVEVENSIKYMKQYNILSPLDSNKDDENWYMNQNYPKHGTVHKNTVRKGDFNKKKAYVHIKTGVSQSPSVVNVQYWIFYGYNNRVDAIPVLGIDVGSHEADWEYVTMRIDTQNGKIGKIYGSQHSGGDWYNLSELDTFNGHSVLYVSRGGHANYGNTAFHFNPLPLTDVLDKSGFKWELKEDFEIVAFDHYIIDGYEWMKFKGNWGANGVGSPGIKEEWLNRDEE